MRTSARMEELNKAFFAAANGEIVLERGSSPHKHSRGVCNVAPEPISSPIFIVPPDLHINMGVSTRLLNMIVKVACYQSNKGPDTQIKRKSKEFEVLQADCASKERALRLLQDEITVAMHVLEFEEWDKKYKSSSNSAEFVSRPIHRTYDIASEEKLKIDFYCVHAHVFFGIS